MIRCAIFLFVLIASASFGAQGSGIFFQANASQGKMRGDTLAHFEGCKIGSIDGDTVRFILNGEELADTKFLESGYHKGLLNMSPVQSVNIQEGEFSPIGIGFRMNFPQ